MHLVCVGRRVRRTGRPVAVGRRVRRTGRPMGVGRRVHPVAVGRRVRRTVRPVGVGRRVSVGRRVRRRSVRPVSVGRRVRRRSVHPVAVGRRVRRSVHPVAVGRRRSVHPVAVGRRRRVARPVSGRERARLEVEQDPCAVSDRVPGHLLVELVLADRPVLTTSPQRRHVGPGLDLLRGDVFGAELDPPIRELPAERHELDIAVLRRPVRTREERMGHEPTPRRAGFIRRLLRSRHVFTVVVGLIGHGVT